MLESGLSLEDTMAIHAMISLYGHLIDDRQFSRLDEIFTQDAVFDLTAYGGEKHQGLAAIQRLMLDSDEHPLAHHASNIVVTADETAAELDDTKRESRCLQSARVICRSPSLPSPPSLATS